MNRIQIGFNPDPSRTAMFSTFKAPAQTVDFCCCLIAVWPDGCVSLANYQASRRPPRRPTNRLVRLVGPPSQITRREMGTKGIDPRSPLHLSVIILFFSSSYGCVATSFIIFGAILARSHVTGTHTRHSLAASFIMNGVFSALPTLPEHSTEFHRELCR